MANTINSSLSLLELDHATLKESFKTYLKTQPLFKDYDFEGSNINVLLDVLAYNTFKNNFYHNMVISEAFLDSAQLRPSVVSRAKELNYLPRSKQSAKAKVRVTFEATGASAPYIIPKGSPFTALVKNRAYTFTLPENVIVSSSNNTYTFDSFIYEGIYLRDSYIVDNAVEFPKYRITNKEVDTDSLTVSVFEDGSETADVYKVTDTLLGLQKTSKVFFLQAVDDGYYEVLFGDNFFGRSPKVGSTVVLQYRISGGAGANGAKGFSVDFDPTGSDELSETPELEVLEVAADGLEQETIESIRLYAPRYFAAQRRAVAADDYASLILSQFSGTIDDVTVYGGETVEPKLYGRVIIAVKPASGELAPNFIKDEITNYLTSTVSIPTRVIIVDPDYYYLQVRSTIQFDLATTDKTANEIKGLVDAAIQEFSGDNLEKFDRDFRYSRFVKAIDDADASITSNDTSVKIIKRLFPKTDAFFSANLSYNNQFHPGRIGYDGHPIVTSSSFTYVDPTDNTHYPFSYLRDNGLGALEVYTSINNQSVVLNPNIGTVNYTEGEIVINKLLVSAYGDYLSLYAIPLTKDIIMNKDKLLFIESSDISLTVTGKIN